MGLKLHLYGCLLLVWVSLHDGGNCASAGGGATTRDQLRKRRLSQELFLSYEPATVVTDHAAIDLDQQAIEEQLALGTEEGRQTALNIYTQGAFSQSYAEITLSSPLTADVGRGVAIFGLTAAGLEIRLQTMNAVAAGDTVLAVQYQASPLQASYTDCHVGGNPEPNVEGCLAPNGSVEIDSLGMFTYTYNPLEDNFNARTLQGFSVQARETMYNCSYCPLETYQKFYQYYGAFDYANRWILAAFHQGDTSFASVTNFAWGNADFSLYGMEGTAEAIQKGTVLLNVWMMVIREMEKAVASCEQAAEIDAIHAWDSAVAFYIGSVPKSSMGGYLLYTLAEKRCENFGTCQTSGPSLGMAKVNEDILANFRSGKQSIFLGNCLDARNSLERITQLMTVPLVQGTLRYAYIQDRQNDRRDKAEAVGAVFAASLLPLVHACSQDDALRIYKDMRTGGTPRFLIVKGALERNYACLGITCADVGGLVDVASDGYLSEAEPCQDNPADDDDIDLMMDSDCLTSSNATLLLGNMTNMTNMTLCNSTATENSTLPDPTTESNIGISASRSYFP